MGRRDSDAYMSESIAIGIKGDRHSLCGAIKRFERHGPQWNGFLSLKERCARRIATIKDERLKCIVLAYLSSNLYKYVTKDIFNLQHNEFASKYPKPFYMCQDCTMDSYEDPTDCRCPKMDTAIDALNNHIFKRTNDKNKHTMKHKQKEFRLFYKIPNDADDHTDELKRPTSFFLYLSPTYYDNCSDSDYGIFHRYYLVNSQISAEDKFLFVDAMRFLGAFRSEYEQPQVVLYRRREYVF